MIISKNPLHHAPTFENLKVIVSIFISIDCLQVIGRTSPFVTSGTGWPWAELAWLILFANALTLGAAQSQKAMVVTSALALFLLSVLERWTPMALTGMYFYFPFLLIGIFLSNVFPEEKKWIFFYTKVQFASTYLYSGISKLMTPEWVDGTVVSQIWKLAFNLYDMPEHWPLLSAWVLIAAQISYVAFCFFRPAQKSLFFIMVIMHLCIAFSLGYWMFSFLMICLNYAFLVDSISDKKTLKSQET